jgi:hypothetical protein
LLGSLGHGWEATFARRATKAKGNAPFPFSDLNIIENAANQSAQLKEKKPYQ